ncbi:flavodoxin reductase [Microbacterium sp.]|uniref:flavodoxin reductase n=1 Tax=Microbacterium sp. TaxID=51671 RepID=UPI0039E3AC4E
MITALTGVRQRVLALLGRLSMYRLVLLALGVLIALALALSAAELVSPRLLDLLVSLAVLTAATMATDALAQRLLHLPWRVESSAITAAILLFVLQPASDLSPAVLGGLALAGIFGAVSKYLIAWRGRHLLNPAAVGAAVVTITGLGTFSAWWVGTPALFIPVLMLGLVVAWRTEKVRVVLLFLVIAVAVSVVRQAVQLSGAGLAFDAGQALSAALLQSPYLFLGLFMLSEPLTLPPRRWQQFAVTCLVGVLAGWPISVGAFTLGQERALLIGNVLAALLARRAGVRLRLTERARITPGVQQLTFQASGGLRFTAGQYLELAVPHRRPDARGTRREFSIVSSPADLPAVRIAYRGEESSYKKALAAAAPGAQFAVTGVWGDFVLPRGEAPVLLVAAGIGVTPFVSQLRSLEGAGCDVVLVHVASSAAELAFREELESLPARVVVFTRDRPDRLPAHWTWAGGVRLDAASLGRAVPDLSSRHAFVSGPPGLIADLAPALRGARSLTTDAFAGY